MLQSRGPAAESINNLWWFMFWPGLVVYLIVMGLLVYVSVRKWRQPVSTNIDRPNEKVGNALVWGGGVFITTIIVGAVLIYTLQTGRNLSPLQGQGDVTIEVVGHMFWWEVNYLDHDITTANELYVPVGQRVQMQLISRDVIHSFWVPKLQGKMDVNPYETNYIWIEAAEPGVYQGLCAEYCGAQHANMYFEVIAVPPEEFDSWIAARQEVPSQPTTAQIQRGQEVYFEAGCANCHAVRGVTDSIEIGVAAPDLTDFASRRTIGAGVVPNNRGNLGGWIVDPQGMKPGNNMPPTDLNSEDLVALLDYLETLR